MYWTKNHEIAILHMDYFDYFLYIGELGKKILIPP